MPPFSTNPPLPPTLKSLSSRNTPKDLRSALNSSALFIVPLEDGSFALADREQHFYLIIPDLPTRDEFMMFHLLLNTNRMEAGGKFYGEPSVADLARDIHRAAQPLPRPKPSGPVDFSNLF